MVLAECTFFMLRVCPGRSIKNGREAKPTIYSLISLFSTVFVNDSVSSKDGIYLIAPSAPSDLLVHIVVYS